MNKLLILIMFLTLISFVNATETPVYSSFTFDNNYPTLNASDYCTIFTENVGNFRLNVTEDRYNKSKILYGDDYWYCGFKRNLDTQQPWIYERHDALDIESGMFTCINNCYVWYAHYFDTPIYIDNDTIIEYTINTSQILMPVGLTFYDENNIELFTMDIAGQTDNTGWSENITKACYNNWQFTLQNTSTHHFRNTFNQIRENNCEPALNMWHKNIKQIKLSTVWTSTATAFMIKDLKIVTKNGNNDMPVINSLDYPRSIINYQESFVVNVNASDAENDQLFYAIEQQNSDNFYKKFIYNFGTVGKPDYYSLGQTNLITNCTLFNDPILSNAFNLMTSINWNLPQSMGIVNYGDLPYLKITKNCMWSYDLLDNFDKGSIVKIGMGITGKNMGSSIMPYSSNGDVLFNLTMVMDNSNYLTIFLNNTLLFNQTKSYFNNIGDNEYTVSFNMKPNESMIVINVSQMSNMLNSLLINVNYSLNFSNFQGINFITYDPGINLDLKNYVVIGYIQGLVHKDLQTPVWQTSNTLSKSWNDLGTYLVTIYVTDDYHKDLNQYVYQNLYVTVTDQNVSGSGTGNTRQDNIYGNPTIGPYRTIIVPLMSDFPSIREYLFTNSWIFFVVVFVILFMSTKTFGFSFTMSSIVMFVWGLIGLASMAFTIVMALFVSIAFAPYVVQVFMPQMRKD